MKKIAYILTEFPDKFGVPRQSGLIKESFGRIVFEKEYRNDDSLRGLEEFSHIWVLWEFLKENKDSWSPTVRPPLLGGNKRMGVFATRSPNRPNPIGLSVLKLERIEEYKDFGKTLLVSGCDMIDNTAILDIKPYLSYCDSIPDAKGGFTENLKERSLVVDFPLELLKKVPKDKKNLVMEVLKSDPRPSYQNDAKRVYGVLVKGLEIKFLVDDKNLTVLAVENIEKSHKK